MRVREATAADARAVHELLDGIYREGLYFVNDSVEPYSHLEARVVSRPPRSLYLVAESDPGASPQVVGWLELHRSPARRLEHVAVLTLAVAPGARRRGAGRALLHASYAWCRRVGVRKVSLNVRSSNEAAVQLYLSEGFELEGRERRHVLRVELPGEEYDDNLIMGLWFD